MLQKKKTAKEIWDALVSEMTKKPKMVATSFQRQLCSMKYSEDDDLRENMDNVQDLYAQLNDMESQSLNMSSLTHPHLPATLLIGDDCPHYLT